MANIIIDKSNLSDPCPQTVLVGGNCYKFLEENDKTPTTGAPTGEMSECDCCNTVSVEYAECDTPANKIYVDPSVLSTLNPPPGTVEISNTCYETPVCSATAIDTFSIDSEPVDCDDGDCAGIPDCLDCSGCPSVTMTASGFTGGVGACNFTFNPNGVYTMLPTANPCEFSGTAPGASGFAILSCGGAGNWSGILLVGTPSAPKPTFAGTTPSFCPQGIPYVVNFGCNGSIVVS